MKLRLCSMQSSSQATSALPYTHLSLPRQGSAPGRHPGQRLQTPQPQAASQSEQQGRPGRLGAGRCQQLARKSVLEGAHGAVWLLLRRLLLRLRQCGVSLYEVAAAMPPLSLLLHQGRHPG